MRERKVPHTWKPFVHPVYFTGDAGQPLLDANGNLTLPPGIETWACPGIEIDGGTTIPLLTDGVATEVELSLHVRNSGNAAADLCYARLQLCAASTMPDPIQTVFNDVLMVDAGDAPLELAPGFDKWWDTTVKVQLSYAGHRCLYATTWGAPGDFPIASSPNQKPDSYADRHVAQLNLSFVSASVPDQFSTPLPPDFPELPELPADRGAFAFWAQNGLGERGTFRLRTHSSERETLWGLQLCVHWGRRWQRPVPACVGVEMGFREGERKACMLVYPLAQGRTGTLHGETVDLVQTQVRPTGEVPRGGIRVRFL